MGETVDIRTMKRQSFSKKSGSGLTEAQEAYLKTFYGLSARVVHVNHLGVHLRLSASDVSRLTEPLRRVGLCRYERFGFLELTREGRHWGAFLLRRQALVEQFLNRIGVTEGKEEALRLAHSLSPAATERLELFLQSLGDRSFYCNTESDPCQQENG